jgi:hypothetical protein
MQDLPYIVRMEGGDTFARFQFSADADIYTRNRSRKYPEVVFAVEHDYGSGIMVSCTKRYQAGRLVKIPAFVGQRFEVTR